MNEDVNPKNMRIHSLADELIACLEGEIAKRDARIAELEYNYQDCNANKEAFANNAISLQESNTKLRAELAAIKAQEPVAWMLKNEKGRIEEILPYMPCASDMQPYWPEPLQLYAAPAAPAADAWIPVGERLPGEDDQVLCWCEDETVAWAEVSSHHNSFFTDMTHELLPVTHWMPLPSAPSANSAKGVV